MANLSDKMSEVLKRVGNPKLDKDHFVTGESAIVHDLGIIGDDWDGFYKALRDVFQRDFQVAERFNPNESSHDAAMIGSAHGLLAKTMPPLRRWYVSRIRCERMTLAEIEKLILNNE